MTLKEITGQNIRKYRNQLGWTQEKLAIRSRLSVNYVSALERGRVNSSVDTLQKIATALKIEIHLLLVNDGEEG